MRKSIAIDMDQVLANFYRKMVVMYNETFNENLTEQQFMLADRNDLDPEKGKQFFEILNGPTFFRDLELLDADSIEVVRQLNDNFDVYIATAAMEVPGSFNAKYDWLREHFPFLNTQNFVFCGNKAVINTDYLIDDSPNQLRAFKGQGILYSMPYNEHVEGFVKVHNWKEIGEYFLGVRVK
ncbi:5'-3'-deoxyribonucleotidase [Solibacillus sp. CAU 1738]|uniref:5' nucleotidase, NT5C type n=1 Tax=Solibacillus sp. CAU 1738 TaxID=3140363 RepID=UPI003260C38A